MSAKPPSSGRERRLPKARVRSPPPPKTLLAKKERTWKVKVIGAVSRPQGGTRVAVPHGDYLMAETSLATYLLSRPAGPKFALTAAEVNTYLDERRLKIVEGLWP
jgi:hypothetical protein